MTGLALERIDRARHHAPPEPPLVSPAEQQYRWLMDHSPVAMCVHAGGRYVYVNQTLLRKLGARSADEMLGRKITDFVHPDSLPAVRSQRVYYTDLRIDFASPIAIEALEDLARQFHP